MINVVGVKLCVVVLAEFYLIRSPLRNIFSRRANSRESSEKVFITAEFKLLNLVPCWHCAGETFCFDSGPFWAKRETGFSPSMPAQTGQRMCVMNTFRLSTCMITIMCESVIATCSKCWQVSYGHHRSKLVSDMGFKVLSTAHGCLRMTLQQDLSLYYFVTASINLSFHDPSS